MKREMDNLSNALTKKRVMLVLYRVSTYLYYAYMCTYQLYVYIMSLPPRFQICCILHSNPEGAKSPTDFMLTFKSNQNYG